MQEKVCIGWEVSEAIGMCLDDGHCNVWDCWMIISRCVQNSKGRFQLAQAFQQSTHQKTKKLASSVKAPVIGL